MDQVLLRAEEVARVLNIGRSKAYELMASGQLPVVRIGRSVRVPAKGFREWLDARLTASPDGERGPADDDEAGRFLWCIEPEAAFRPAAMGTQAEPATHD